jgi:hypothetical protein
MCLQTRSALCALPPAVNQKIASLACSAEGLPDALLMVHPVEGAGSDTYFVSNSHTAPVLGTVHIAGTSFVVTRLPGHMQLPALVLSEAEATPEDTLAAMAERNQMYLGALTRVSQALEAMLTGGKTGEGLAAITEALVDAGLLEEVSEGAEVEHA